MNDAPVYPLLKEVIEVWKNISLMFGELIIQFCFLFYSEISFFLTLPWVGLVSSVFIPADVLLSLLFFVTQAFQPAFMFPRVQPSEVFTALLPVSLLDCSSCKLMWSRSSSKTVHLDF